MQIIKRKIRSAIWRLQNAIQQASQSTVKFVVELLTERYWLLDYLPTFFKKRQGVLLVRLDLIGDFVLWLDSAKAYRQIYPDQKITLAVNSICAELARTLTFWDEVISIDVHRLRTDCVYRLRVAVLLRSRNFATAVHPTFSREFVGDLVVRSTTATERIGYVGNAINILNAQKAKTDMWYSKLVANPSVCEMELSINAHFVRTLGNLDFLSQIPIISRALVLPTKYQFNRPYVVIAVGASWQSRSWPISHFAGLIQQLSLSFDGDFILCGGIQDQTLCEQLLQKVLSCRVVNLSGNTSLLEFVEIIRGATVVVSNESSAVHIAAATATPSVCILGGGHFGRFMPYKIEHRTEMPLYTPTALWHNMDCFGCSWRCKFQLQAGQAVPCISMISLDLVAKRTQALLTQILDGAKLHE